MQIKNMFRMKIRTDPVVILGRGDNKTMSHFPAQDMLEDMPCKMDLAAAKSLAHSNGSSTYSHVSNQSSAGFFLTDSDGEDTKVDRPRLGSWAGRQAYFPAGAQHLPEQVPKVSKAKQTAHQRSDIEAAWRYRFKHKWRREQLKGRLGEAGFIDSDVGYDDGGWDAAMQLLGAAAPELGVNLDAWAALAAGEEVTSSNDPDCDTRLGLADAALALDEEMSGKPFSRPPAPIHRAVKTPWAPSMGRPTVVLLDSAIPELKIRRVTMQGSAAKKLAAPTVVATPPPPAGIVREDIDRVKMLASRQLAILKCTDNRLGVSVQRDPDWVGNHLPSTELGEPDVEARIPFITVQLTDPATGGTRVFVRGARSASQWRIMAIFKQQVKHVAAMHQLPAPRLQLLASGLLAV